jgi:uncharacterized protein (UPF0297 family)
MNMEDMTRTQYIQLTPEELKDAVSVKDVFGYVYAALAEKGYNPVNQIVGYIMSGDPTYITSHKGARSMIMKAERDELVEEMLKFYIENKGWVKK